MEKSKDHYWGEIEILDGKLIGLGGQKTRSVELFDQVWKNKKIPFF